MKPSQINVFMDIARAVKRNGGKFNPMFVGPPGVGKSEIVQAWCKKNNLQFIDIRAAYYEAPDLKGFPVVEKNDMNKMIQIMATPSFWPQDPNWEGVIFLDEVNRGAASVTNCFMQLLTDGKLEEYVLPKRAIICAAINPENTTYDVNNMDPALRNRFAMFTIDYDRASFIEYMTQDKWHEHVINFVKTGSWKFVIPEDVGNTPGSQYISPRSLGYLSNALNAGLMDYEKNVQMDLFESVLGRNYAKTFMQFISDDQPVFYQDLLDNKKKAMKRLERYSDPSDYKNGHLSITIESILKDGANIEDDLLRDVLITLPADQAYGLIKSLDSVRKGDGTLGNKLCDKYKELAERFRTSLKKQA